MLKVGDSAPDFELQSETGEPIRLHSFRGKKNVVLFFYPKDDTSVCTREACAFRDSYADFVTHETTVLGISADNAQSHAKFVSKYQLPFTLLTDRDGRVRREFGVARTFGMIPGRATFVIDKQGVVRGVFVAQFKALEHVKDALRTLGSIA